MAIPFPSPFLIITLLLFSATAPSAHAIIFNGKSIAIANVLLGGTIVCADTSIATAGTYKVIPQAPFELRCGNSSTETVVKQGVTDLSGVYFLLLTGADTLLIDKNVCYLRVTIPPYSSCTLSVANGFLRIPFVVLDVLDTLLGNLLVLGQDFKYGYLSSL
ncbi:hypothetical protein F0562_022757 [Nyssa sinensis]|uniref:Uncharacterized protein n=1 Tax=Nyssa sinensis TaxID=561372 RepID=A0A5J5BEK9_9ASTE|nr:hypothetical protein F0562_022757 [Nyssa sinensis]